jgi:Uma2 family endonuclease
VYFVKTRNRKLFAGKGLISIQSQGKITGEQLLEMSPDLIGHIELVKGEIIQIPPAGEIHGELSMNLGFLLKGYVKENDLGKVYAAETGFYTARNPDTVRAADSAFIAKNRLPEKPSGGYLETVPDLTVEVVSLHDRPSAILEKVEECLNAGVKCIWVVYPKSRQGYVYQPDQPVEILSEDDTLTGSDVIPGFQCKVSEIFE